MSIIYERLSRLRGRIEENFGGELRPVVVLKESELFRPGEILNSNRPYNVFFNLLKTNAERYGLKVVDELKTTPNKKFDGVSVGMSELAHTVKIKRGRHAKKDAFLNALGCLGVSVKDVLGRDHNRDAQSGTTGDQFAEFLIAARDSIEAAYQKRSGFKLD